MQVKLPAGVEVDVDGEAVALRVDGRAILQVVEDEAAEIAIALGAAAEVLRGRRAGLESAPDVRSLVPAA